jgi:hypothetical protein
VSENNGEPKTFGGLTPAEASQRAAEKRSAEAKARREAPVELTSEQKIMAGLRKRAEAGDFNAARELREWIKVERAMLGGGVNDDILSSLKMEQIKILTDWIDANEAEGYNSNNDPKDRRVMERDDREIGAILRALRGRGFRQRGTRP